MSLTYTPQAEIGSSIPDFKLPGVDGKTYSLSDFKNAKALVFMFICNHCPYVKAIEDRLIELGKDLKALGVAVIGICSNDSSEHPEDSFENLKKRALEKNYSFVYLHDEDQEIAKAFGAVCTPDFYVYGNDRKLAYRGRLDDSWKDASKVKKRELFSAVENILKNKEISEKQVPSMGCNIKWVTK
jgi:peroxiredoxin